MQDFRDRVLHKAVTALINHEVNMMIEEGKRKGTRHQRYFNSSPTRNLFAKIMVHAGLSNKYYSISQIAKVLDISRVATITMVDECEAEGWIHVLPGPRNSRICQASQEIVDSAVDWFNLYRRSAQETGYLANFRMLENLEIVMEEGFKDPTDV